MLGHLAVADLETMRRAAPGREESVMGSRLLIVIAILLASGCKDFPGADGRYATPGRGGWDNFRAEAPVDVPTTPTSY